VITVLHIITGLNVGGAETTLCKLLENMDRTRFRSAVVSMLPEGALGQRAREAGAALYSLNMKRGLPDPFALLRLRRLIKELRPDLIQTWMYHANLMGAVAARGLKIPLFWNIMHFNLDKNVNKPMTRIIVKLCALLLKSVPQKIVYCAQRSAEVHAKIGYDNARATVIPNGFDTDLFKPDQRAGKEFREELSAADGCLLIGVIGRFDPQKDHNNLFRAADLIVKELPTARFVLCGDGIIPQNGALAAMIGKGIKPLVHLLGRRMDLPKIYAALDLLVLPSIGEAFPSVVGEAMSCGVPCVVTDVGDCARIVGSTGISVKPGDPALLAEAIKKMALLPQKKRKELGEKARERIKEHYDIRLITDMYEDLYQSAV
jgi:glycosyltransferase involved in cell wall biosynthesis